MASPPRRNRTPEKKEKTEGSGSKTPRHSPSRSLSRSPRRRSPRRSPRRSRAPRRSRGRQPREIVVERIFREGGGSNTWPQLTRSNYHQWSLRMKLKLQARHLWEAVEYPDIAEYGEDRSALDAICSAVPEDMVAVLATKDTAHDAWEAIKTLRIGDDRVRRSTAQTLRAEYESIALRPGEAIEEFALRLTNITQRMAALGDPEPEPRVVAKYLRVAHSRYKL